MRAKVLHIITRLDPGGSADNTLLTCRHLVDHGWEAVLASGPGWTEEAADVGGTRVPVVPIPALRRDPSPVADLRAFWQIYRLLRRERPAILHTHSAKAGILGRWAGLLARVPHIVHTPHGHVLYGYARGLKNWAYLLAERLTAPITHRLVALSEGERRESAQAGIGKPDKWIVVPSGVDVEALPTASGRRGSGPLRIGTVARLDPVKGVDVLVRATALLEPAGEPDSRAVAEVVVWGDGQQRGALEALAEELGVEEVVHFVATHEPVADFLASLDIYTQPSRNEGMGRALALAQGAGLPVVASNVCGIPDVVRDGETGILVPPDDPPALASALSRLLEDASLRRSFASAARSWIMSRDETGFPRFGVEAMLSRIEHLYSELTGIER